MTKYRLKHIQSGEIIEFRNKSSYEYCLNSSSYELCHILSVLDNSREFEPIEENEEIEEMKENKEELNELEKQLTMTSSNIKKKNRK